MCYVPSLIIFFVFRVQIHRLAAPDAISTYFEYEIDRMKLISYFFSATEMISSGNNKQMPRNYGQMNTPNGGWFCFARQEKSHQTNYLPIVRSILEMESSVSLSQQNSLNSRLEASSLSFILCEIFILEFSL